MAHREEDKERLSSFKDGVLTPPEAARMAGVIAGNDELRRTWMRYHLIGEVIRAPGRVAWSGDLAQRVRNTVANEPALLAPRLRRTAAPQQWFRPLAGLAVAASMAAAAVMLLPRITGIYPAAMNSTSSLASAPTGEAKTGTTVVFGAPSASWPADNATAQPVTVVKPIPRSRLNSYLVNYSEQRALIGSPGMPYVRVVGYEPEQP
jgi:sigma-E factor negative regulatory protein RseA